MSDEQAWRPDGLNAGEYRNLDTGMVAMHELFTSATKAGFTELQGLTLVALILTHGQHGQGKTPQ